MKAGLPEKLENAYIIAAKEYDGSTTEFDVVLDVPVPSECDSIVKTFARRRGYSSTFYSFPTKRYRITFGVTTPTSRVGVQDTKTDIYF